MGASRVRAGVVARHLLNLARARTRNLPRVQGLCLLLTTGTVLWTSAPQVPNRARGRTPNQARARTITTVCPNRARPILNQARARAITTVRPNQARARTPNQARAIRIGVETEDSPNLAKARTTTTITPNQAKVRFCMEGKNPCVYGWSENKPV